jgi:hypothetical protein
MMLSAFIFSFGPVIQFNKTVSLPGLYAVLHNFFPGYDGIRVPARIFIMISISVSLFAGIGLSKIKHNLAKLLIIILAVAEYLVVPLSVTSIEVGMNKIPQVYVWLSQQKDDFVIAEFPMAGRDVLWQDARYMYYSIYHWKKLINGYSSYVPPDNILLREYLAEGPVTSVPEILRSYNVKYAIVHSSGTVAGLVPVKQFGSDTVYRIPEQREPADIQYTDNSILFDEQPVIRSITSNVNRDNTKYMFDRDIFTCWSTQGHQQKGDYIIVDLGNEQRVTGIILYIKKDMFGFPRSYKTETSIDGKTWVMAGREQYPVQVLQDFKHGLKSLYQKLKFNTSSCRYIKVTLTRTCSLDAWLVNEVYVLTNKP